MLRGISVTWCCLFAALGSGTVSAQVKLEYKFPDGAQSRNFTEVKLNQTLILNGQEIKTNVDQTLNVDYVNGQRAADGTIQVEQTLKEMQVTLSLPGGLQLTFDSNRPDAPPPGTPVDFLLDSYKALVGSRWKTTYNQANQPTAITGSQDVLDKADDRTKAALANRLDDAYLLESEIYDHGRIPSRPVAVGDTWELTRTMRLDAGQALKFQVTYEYQGTEERAGRTLHRIGVRYTGVEYSVSGESPFKLTKSNLKVASTEGAILFDNELGQIVESREKVQIQGDLGLEVNSVELSGTLDLTLEQNANRS